MALNSHKPHLNYLPAFDAMIESRGGIPLIDQGVIVGAIGSLGGTDSQDEVVSKEACHNQQSRGEDRVIQIIMETGLEFAKKGSKGPS